MSGSESDVGVSMMDVIREENRLDEQARLVLGGSEDTHCSYPQGYVKRQALYACLTCYPPLSSDTCAGVCLACSNTCHQGHDLVEMYTKRNFRCDCGNSLFGDNKCLLVPEKDSRNVNNNYNHNFRGLYCNCDRPYPDPEREEQEDMLQCVMCEDWFHITHLESSVSSDEENWELVCASCVQNHQFLKLLNKTPVGHEDNLGNNAERVETICRRDVVDSGKGEGAGECQNMFLPDGWRNTLCRCNRCSEMYSLEKVEFLLDPEDTVRWYEEKGATNEEDADEDSLFNRALEQLAGIDRVSQLDVVQGFNDMKENFKEYLKKFLDNGKMVREEDIREFFDGLEKNKRRRFE